MLETLRKQLHRHEGFSARPYKDTVGKLTVGYGRNLDDVGISVAEADHLLDNDMRQAITEARRLFDNFDELTENRQVVLANMAFNLGAARLAMFARLRRCVQEGDWPGAAREMLESRWAEQVGNRAQELATMMERG